MAIFQACQWNINSAQNLPSHEHFDLYSIYVTSFKYWNIFSEETKYEVTTVENNLFSKGFSKMWKYIKKRNEMGVKSI